MAKISFTKLGLKANQEIKTIEYNGQNIEVKQYLPIQDKLGLISDVLNDSIAQDKTFANPVKVDTYMRVAIVEYYTNISFTEKQKEDVAKLYDLLEGSGLIEKIIEIIPEEEYNLIWSGVKRSVSSFYDYKNSVLGILENITADYSALDYEAADIQKKLNDPQNMELLRGILSKLG